MCQKKLDAPARETGTDRQGKSQMYRGTEATSHGHLHFMTGATEILTHNLNGAILAFNFIYTNLF